MIKLEN